MTKHQSALTALDKQAQRYLNQRSQVNIADEALFDEAIDKTETVENFGATENRESAAPHRMDIERSELEEIRTIDDYLLEVHGAPGASAINNGQLIFKIGLRPVVK